MTCTKIKHATAEGAERHRAGLEARDCRRGVPHRPGHLRVYYCDQCSCYHVGHNRKRRKEPTQ